MCVRPWLVAGSAPLAPLPRTTGVADVPGMPEGPGGSVVPTVIFSPEGLLMTGSPVRMVSVDQIGRI
jgi:hypothetical protein